MSSLISRIPGAGEVVLEAFNRAGYRRIRDLYNFDLGEVAGDRNMMTAINDMRAEDERSLNARPDRYYRALGTRCVNIVTRVRNATSVPYYPDHLICPITLDLIQDPVIAPSGYTYERADIMDWIAMHNRDPMTRDPLTADQLYPNRALRQAIAYYRNNYQTFVLPSFE